jgi:DNA-binding NtrC family response regulator
MPNVDGIGLLEYLTENRREIPLVLITAYGTIEAAVEAMKLGAADFITKPFNKNFILHVIERVFTIRGLHEENKLLRDGTGNSRLVCESEAMRAVMEHVSKLADVPTPLLVTGESGVGKGLIAKAIHDAGENGRPFVTINCPTIPDMLLESELFGFRKGAFTGADTDFIGRIRMSEGGTLFLDEIADIPLAVQSKLLRVLEEKRFEPLGSNTTIEIQTRIICATNSDLRQLVDRGTFRKDLYYRINTITIDIPPLRERIADIEPLARTFLNMYSRDMNKEIDTIASDALDALREYPWPGNVRELRNVIERAVVLAAGSSLELLDLPRELVDQREYDPERPNLLDTQERRILIEALEKCDGNVTAAAKSLGISRGRMRYRMNKHRISTG